MYALEELANDAAFAVSDLLDDDGLESFSDLSAIEKIQYRYLHGDCDDFTLVLHRATGWAVRSITSPDGPLHRLNEAPDGRLVDAAGWTDLPSLKARYKTDQLHFSKLGGEEFCMSCLTDAPEDLQPVVAAMLHLDTEPFTQLIKTDLLAYAASVGLTDHDSAETAGITRSMVGIGPVA